MANYYIVAQSLSGRIDLVIKDSHVLQTLSSHCTAEYAAWPSNTNPTANRILYISRQSKTRTHNQIIFVDHLNADWKNTTNTTLQSRKSKGLQHIQQKKLQ